MSAPIPDTKALWWYRGEEDIEDLLEDLESELEERDEGEVQAPDDDIARAAEELELESESA